jgi:alanine-glyoxylate transaminase/serine-glyoxylate transaminase/serine-pyruvate transaminase
VDEAAVRKALLAEFGIEIGGGLGPLAGQVWRIGLMGESSRHEHVVTLLSALEQIFRRHGWATQPGHALNAALRSYAASS